MQPTPQCQWLLCVQEPVWDNVVARLKLRLGRMKCVALNTEAERGLVENAVHEAQEQGATVSHYCVADRNKPQKSVQLQTNGSLKLPVNPFIRLFDLKRRSPDCPFCISTVHKQHVSN